MILFFLNIGLLAYLFYFLWTKQNAILKKYFWPALLVKLLAGILLGLMYSRYYDTGDTFHYYHDGKVLAAFARGNFTEYLQFLWHHEGSVILAQLSFVDARALFFVKTASMLSLITGDNYWLASVYCSAVAFVGSLSLVQTVNRHLANLTLPALIAFMFFPSVVFWSSGLIKESVACGALFYLSSLFIRAWFAESIPIRSGLLGVAGMWVIWALKYYYAAILIPVAFAFLSYRYIVVYIVHPKGRIGQIATLVVLFVIPLALLSFAHPNFHYQNFLEVMVANSEIYTQYSSPEDLIHYYSLEPGLKSVLMNTPLALFSGLFRPLVTEAGNALQLIASLENLILLSLTVWVLIRLRSQSIEPHFILLMAVLFYVGLLCVFLTLSTPNFGTLSRYRVGYLPYFVMLLLSEERLNGTLQRLSARLFG